MAHQLFCFYHFQYPLHHQALLDFISYMFLKFFLCSPCLLPLPHFGLSAPLSWASARASQWCFAHHYSSLIPLQFTLYASAGVMALTFGADQFKTLLPPGRVWMPVTTCSGSLSIPHGMVPSFALPLHTGNFPHTTWCFTPPPSAQVISSALNDFLQTWTRSIFTQSHQ